MTQFFSIETTRIAVIYIRKKKNTCLVKILTFCKSLSGHKNVQSTADHDNGIYYVNDENVGSETQSPPASHHGGGHGRRKIHFLEEAITAYCCSKFFRVA
jgi:hypothetical protein